MKKIVLIILMMLCAMSISISSYGVDDTYTSTSLSAKMTSVVTSCTIGSNSCIEIIEDIDLNINLLECSLRNARTQKKMMVEKKAHFDRVRISAINMGSYILEDDIPSTFGIVTAPIESEFGYGMTNMTIIQYEENSEWPVTSIEEE